jgi:hypothetical protein
LLFKIYDLINLIIITYFDPIKEADVSILKFYRVFNAREECCWVHNYTRETQFLGLKLAVRTTEKSLLQSNVFQVKKKIWPPIIILWITRAYTVSPLSSYSVMRISLKWHLFYVIISQECNEDHILIIIWAIWSCVDMQLRWSIRSNVDAIHDDGLSHRATRFNTLNPRKFL